MIKGNVSINDFEQVSDAKLEHLKSLGKPVMGWFSVYTPEEIIYAAGIEPFRIIGDMAPAHIKSRAILYANLCPYTLSCLEEGIQNRYDFLDGVVMVNTCDARRRLYDGWKMYIETPFSYIIDLPKIVTPESRLYFKNQFMKFREAIEKHFKCEISERSLRGAISVYNETRRLLARLYELRKGENPPVTGCDALTIIKASMAGDRKHFNEKLTSLLLEYKNQPSHPKGIDRKRILITGSYFDQLSLIKMIEDLGATVVCEDLSNGVKYFEGTVNVEKEPIEALTDYYLDKAPCARMVDSEKRFNHISKLIKEYSIDAVIYFTLKFCDSNLIDFPYQKNKIGELGMPVLFLEGERALINLGQLKIRIQAFLEIGEEI